MTYHLPTENTASLPQFSNVFGLYHRLLQLLLQCAHTSEQLADDTVLYVIYSHHVAYVISHGVSSKHHVVYVLSRPANSRRVPPVNRLVVKLAQSIAEVGIPGLWLEGTPFRRDLR